MKKYKITIGPDAYFYTDKIAAAMVTVGRLLDSGIVKITIETFDHPEKDNKNADS